MRYLFRIFSFWLFKREGGYLRPLMLVSKQLKDSILCMLNVETVLLSSYKTLLPIFKLMAISSQCFMFLRPKQNHSVQPYIERRGIFIESIRIDEVYERFPAWSK